mgnify:FL=1
MSDTIILNGLSWDKENLEVNGQTHFTYKEAKKEAAKLNKRLPTIKEVKQLLKLPYTWDDSKIGIRIAAEKEYLMTENHLFLPAKGYIVEPSIVINASLFGVYWTSTSNDSSLAKFFGFSKQSRYTNVYYRYGRFTVRCINSLNRDI